MLVYELQLDFKPEEIIRKVNGRGACLVCKCREYDTNLETVKVIVSVHCIYIITWYI